MKQRSAAATTRLENDDADGEGPETDPEDATLVRFRETEVRLPVSDDVGSQSEDEGGGHESHETGPEEFLVVGVGFAHGMSRCQGLKANRDSGAYRWLGNLDFDRLPSLMP